MTLYPCAVSVDSRDTPADVVFDYLVNPANQVY
jgi:hypothetical protein